GDRPRLRGGLSGLLTGRGGRLRTDDAALRTLAGARVGVRTLTARRQTLAVTQPAVAAQVHQALDVHRHLAAEVTLDLVGVLDDLADLARLVLGEVLGAGGEVDARLGDDVVRGLVADPVDVLQRDHSALVRGKIDAGDTSHLN